MVPEIDRFKCKDLLKFRLEQKKNDRNELMLTEKSQLCTSETKRTDNKIISYTHDDEDLNQEKEEYDFIGSQRDKYIESQRNNRNGNILTNCTSTTTENAAVKIFHRRCPYCHTESHVRIAVCKGCSYKFPIKDEETDALVMRGKKAKEGNNTHKMLGRIRKDIIKLYGARIHACLLFTTLYNPSRQRSGYKAHSPFVTKVMEDMEFSLLKAFIKAVREAYLKGEEEKTNSDERKKTKL